jgi:RNA polymerase sigma-70 factor (ECF subfamily)
VPQAHDYYPQCPEPLIIGLARGGDRGAFAELVRRRQSSIRNLMRRCCNDASLADDLAQQVFLKVWLSIRTLRKPSAFESWLKRLAVNTWLQHVRKHDALHRAGELQEVHRPASDSKGVGMDLDDALAMLSPAERLCVILSYQDGMSHPEIAELTDLPLGTVKSHIRRGALKLQEQLSVYAEPTEGVPT